MKAKVWSWTGGQIEEYGEEIREFTAEELVAMTEKYDVLIKSVKIPREKGSFRAHQDRHIQLYADYKIIYLDEKGKGCQCR